MEEQVVVGTPHGAAQGVDNTTTGGATHHAEKETPSLAESEEEQSNRSSSPSCASLCSRDKKREIPKESFYRRELPETCVSFASQEGKAIFKTALADGTMESYFPLAAQYRTQSDPAYCGLGTLTMALNTLAIDPQRVWKGPWRWFSEEMLDCCCPLDVVKEHGIAIGQFSCLAKCNGATATVTYAEDSNVETFRKEVLDATRGTDSVLIVNYSRKTLGQTGTGHYSPIGGYHAEKDMVLIMEVARFKYPPHWVSLPLLFEAMKDKDPATGRSRGIIVLRVASPTNTTTASNG